MRIGDRLEAALFVIVVIAATKFLFRHIPAFQAYVDDI